MLTFLAPERAPALRRIRLLETDVAYTLVRCRRRSIGMLIGAQGLMVRAPRWVSLGEIESVLQEKARWIVRQLQSAQERHAQQQQSRIVWAAGTRIDYLGQPLVLRLDPHARSAAFTPTPPDAPGPATLALALPEDASPDAIRHAVERWMKLQARQHFAARLDHFAPLLGVQWHRLALSSARTRWGSAGRDRAGLAVIRLNWRLMQHHPEIVDYVVVHELSHLRVMDHSPRFWQTVASVLPDHETRRRQLRDQPLALWDGMSA